LAALRSYDLQCVQEKTLHAARSGVGPMRALRHDPTSRTMRGAFAALRTPLFFNASALFVMAKQKIVRW
jgi:hypothetical protein